MEITSPSLLNQKLILKYWGNLPPYERAHAILVSMEEPIKKGDRYLFWHKDKVSEMVWEDYMADITESHAEHLRLPDPFQPGQKKHCSKCDVPTKLKCHCECHRQPEREKCGELLERISKGIIDPTIQEFIDNLRIWRERSEKSDIVLGKPPSTAGCDHSGLKRYCGDAIYCENCKFDVSKEMAKCTLPVPHDGPCKKPDPVEEDIKDILVAIDEGIYTEHYFEKRLNSLVRLARTGV